MASSGETAAENLRAQSKVRALGRVSRPGPCIPAVLATGMSAQACGEPEPRHIRGGSFSPDQSCRERSWVRSAGRCSILPSTNDNATPVRRHDASTDLRFRSHCDQSTSKLLQEDDRRSSSARRDRKPGDNGRLPRRPRAVRWQVLAHRTNRCEAKRSYRRCGFV